jgi:hypothetical protein
MARRSSSMDALSANAGPLSARWSRPPRVQSSSHGLKQGGTNPPVTYQYAGLKPTPLLPTYHDLIRKIKMEHEPSRLLCKRDCRY